MREDYEIKHCSECGKPFVSAYSRTETCGKACSVTRNNRIRREAYRRNPTPHKEKNTRWRTSERGRTWAEEHRSRRNQADGGKQAE